MPLSGKTVATLVAPPRSGATLAKIAQDATNAGYELDWLAPQTAVDIVLPESAPADALLEIVAEQPVDMAVQPVEGRRKKLLIADMDSTMIRQECLDELADFAGFGEKVAAITERAMAGEISFEPALRERVSLLAGLPVGTVQKVLDERIRITPGAKTLVRTMRKNGAFTALVSGGFTAFTGPVSAEIGFEVHHSNRLEDDGAAFTGGLHDPIAGPDTKLERLHAYCSEKNISPSDVIAVGDGANDIPMAKAAGFSVSYYGKAALNAVATTQIRHTDLTALLYFQGYRAEDFADDNT